MVAVRFEAGEPAEIRTLVPDSADDSWSIEKKNGRVSAGWPRHRMYWGLVHELEPSGEDFVGSTWYTSHVLRDTEYEPERVDVRWNRAPCP